MTDAGHAINIGLGGLTFDVYLADRRLGELTQPGANTILARLFLVERTASLEHYRDLVTDLTAGRIGARAFDELTRLEGPLGEHEPLIYGDLGDPTATVARANVPARPLSASPDPTNPDAGSAAPVPGIRRLPMLPAGPDPGGTVRCDWWQDCLDAFVEIAENYVLGSLCPRESEIGSISPSAVCRGQTGVQLQIRPAPGKSFRMSGLCIPYLQQGQHYRQELTLVNGSSDVITVELGQATTSGCLGFRGPSGGSGGNMAFINTCMRAGREHNPGLAGLLTPKGQPVNVWCDASGGNRFEVVPPPVLEELHASSADATSSSTPGDPSSVTISAEGCRDVTLQWRFGFGGEEPSVNPADYVRVRIIDSGGNILGEGLDHQGSLDVNERDAETYTLLAVADVEGDACGQATATVVVNRTQLLRLSFSGLPRVQTSHDATLTIERSCPAPAEGTTVALESSQPARLQVPSTVTIPEGGVSAATTVDAAGAGCTTVTVTAQADGHKPATQAVLVYDVPIVATVNPASVSACRPFTLTVTGSCFAPDDTKVRLRREGVDIPLDVDTVSTTSITCKLLAGQALKPGQWELTVTSRGLDSQPVPLQATPVTPEIITFAAFSVPLIFGGVWPCVPTPASMGWEVKDAERVTIRQMTVTAPVADETSQSICGTTGGSATHTAAGGRTYRLDAFPAGGGDPQTATSAVPQRSVPRAKGIRFENHTSSQWRLWRYSSATGAWSGSNVATENFIEVPFEACGYQYLFAVNRTAIGDAKADDIAQALTASSANTQVYSLTLLIPVPSLGTDNWKGGEFHLLGDPGSGFAFLKVGS